MHWINQCAVATWQGSASWSLLSAVWTVEFKMSVAESCKGKLSFSLTPKLCFKQKHWNAISSDGYAGYHKIWLRCLTFNGFLQLY